MKLIKILYLYSLKGVLNRFREHPIKLSCIIMVAAFILFLPLFFLGGQNKDSILPYKWLVILSSLLIARFGIKIALKSSDFKVIPQEFTFLLSSVPEKVKKLYYVLIIDTILKSCISYLLLYSLFFLYNGGQLPYLLLNIIIAIILICFITFLSGIISILSTYNIPIMIRIFIFILNLFIVATSIFTYIEGTHYSIFHYMLNYNIADILEVLLSSNFESQTYIKASLAAVTILFITIFLFHVLLTKSKLRAHHILEAEKNSILDKKGNLLNAVCRKLNLLPRNMRLLVGKELIQIWRERSPLYSVILQSILAGIIMLISAKNFEGNIIEMGVLVILAYEAFLLSLFSVPRELKTIWLIKIMNPNWMIITASKLIACYIGSLIMSVPTIILYTIAAHIIMQVDPLICVNIYLWGLITIIPLSVGLGFIMTAFIPFEVIDKKKKVTYKFNGLEGALLFILIFTAVVPTWLMLQYKNYAVLVVLFIAYFIFFVVTGLFLAKNKLRKL